ncbi:MAG TPA: hypothetical protein VHR84_17500 [Terriglobales bacterium]|jgi:hypothetical protein|nr:hypothetical protein [Terriglobales bacterium]
MRVGVISVAVTAILVAGLAILELSPDEKPLPPSLPGVSGCRELDPGMRRIGEQVGFQFNVPLRDFTISEGSTDASPLIHGFDIRPKNSAAHLRISWGKQTNEMTPPDPILDLSNHIEKRKVLDDKGKPIGEESWGYRGRGEHWRRIHLLGRCQVIYGSKNEKDVPNNGYVYERDAALFDQIINSACRPSPPVE